MRDTPHGLKPNGFSCLHTSYADMRRVPQTRGRCHNADYWELTQILCTDVDRSHTVAVIAPLARLVGAMEYPPLNCALAAVSTRRACLTRISLILQSDYHAMPFRFVGEQVANAAMGPLMELLVGFAANIYMLPNISHIANHYGLYPILVKGRDES